jgi:4a-hydroxytetrahydrobiopterin dehydratase
MAREEWVEAGGALVRELEFESFAEAIRFVDRLAVLAEREDHHPDIDVRYRRVVVRWWTHTAGGVTDRDRSLAALTDELTGGRAGHSTT